MSSSDEDTGEQRKEQKMISSKQYEAYHIMLWSMRCIKVTRMKNSDKKLFHVQCHRKTYQHGNAGVREQHPTIFKEGTYIFNPIDDLVLSMPFEFIRKLKAGTWTPINRNWLQKLHKHLTQADNNSINHVRFIRRLLQTTGRKDHQNMRMNTKNIYTRYILQRVKIILSMLHRYITSLEMRYGSMEKQNACATLLLTD